MRVSGTSTAVVGVALFALAGAGPSSGTRAVAAHAPAMQTVRVSVPAGLRSAPFDHPRRVRLPNGWRISVWARVSGARLEAWAPDGRLLVSRPGSGDVVELTPRRGAGPGRRTLVRGLHNPHGLAFHGHTLYVAESNRVDAYTYARGAVSHRRVIVPDLPDGGAHPLKSVVVGGKGGVYISVGSSGNISGEDRSASPRRAVVLRWSPTTHRTTVYARGVRNGTALGLDPHGAVWTAVNNRDNLAYPFHRDWDGDGRSDYGKVFQSYVDDHPLEPLARLSSGRDLGWPYCDPDPSVHPGVRGSALTYTRRPFVTDPDTNRGGSRLNCAKLARPEQGLPAHSAPLGLSFVTLPAPFGSGALVTSHGSWNRTPPRPPSVRFFPWRHGTLGAGRVLISGFQDSDGSQWGRTVDTVAGPDHALYLSDDASGTIYRITPAEVRLRPSGTMPGWNACWESAVTSCGRRTRRP